MAEAIVEAGSQEQDVHCAVMDRSISENEVVSVETELLLSSSDCTCEQPLSEQLLWQLGILNLSEATGLSESAGVEDVVPLQALNHLANVQTSCLICLAEKAEIECCVQCAALSGKKMKKKKKSSKKMVPSQRRATTRQQEPTSESSSVTSDKKKPKTYLNAEDLTTGLSPLQVAIKTANLRTVQLLINANASLEYLDHEGNSVFHFAASTNKELINALAQGSTKCLNHRNGNGYTPLHMACLADKPDCVKALLLAGADVNNPASQIQASETPPGYVGNFLQENPNKLHAQDMKFGGTSLHWALSKEVIENLVDVHCDINSRNFDGRTALHIMVMRNRLDCAVALLSRGAKVNLADNEGNTPLHLAVMQTNIAIVQGLVIFGADLSYRNNVGATPRHGLTSDGELDQILYMLHAVGAPRCSPDMDGCTPGCKASSFEFNGVPPPKPVSPDSREMLDTMLSVAGMEIAALRDERNQGGRMLCLDGGGIRGLILITMLLELEKVAKKPIIHCFDWVAGTSTGGILALALASGKTLKECLCLYFRLKDTAFAGRRLYSSEPLENMLKEALGANSVMADISHPKLIVTTVAADRKPVEFHMFRDYEYPADILGMPNTSKFAPFPKPAEQLLWTAARATGAAPPCFRAFGHFLDGGLIANNPTLDAMTEVHEYNLALKATGRHSEVQPIRVIVSLGTGIIPVTEMKEIDIFRPVKLWDASRILVGARTIGKLLIDQLYHLPKPRSKSGSRDRGFYPFTTGQLHVFAGLGPT